MHEAFLTAILASPADDLPRLVYADWLDEQGEAERAEYIRLQIAGGDGDKFLVKNRARWVIPGIGGVQTFRRGFVESLRMSAGEFVANAERIGRLAPVTHLRLPVAVPVLDALAAVPWLARIEHLDLTGNIGIGQRLEDFLSIAKLPNLRSLELRNCQLWPEHAGLLGRLAPRWPRLRRLNLSGNPLGDEGLDHLAAAPALHSLHELVLRCDEQQAIDSIHEAGAAFLAQSPLSDSLRTLDLDGHYLGDQGLLQLLNNNHFQALEYLDLSYNEIGDDPQAIQTLTSASLPSLRKLMFDGNHVHPNSILSLLSWKQLATIDWISLRDVEIDAEVFAQIRLSPWHRKLIFDDSPLVPDRHYNIPP